MKTVDDYIIVQMGDFMLNAGILGLIRALENYHAVEGRDYIIGENELRLSKDYLETTDLADLYFRAMVDLLGKDSRYQTIIDKKPIVDKLYSEQQRTEKQEKQLTDLYTELAKMLERNSFKSGYTILKESGIDLISLDLVKSYKKEKDPTTKYRLYEKLIEILKLPSVRDVLVFKELMYGKIDRFYQGTSFYLPAKLSKNMKEVYEQDFVTPLLEELHATKKPRYRCIECSELSTQKKSISFMIDTTDDIARKKAHYWNMVPDALVCPLCAFVYTFMPVGFRFIGRNSVFINNNVSLPVMKDLMNTYRSRISDQEESKSLKGGFYRIFSTDGIEMLQTGLSNIQVISRPYSSEHYQMQIVDKDIIEKLTMSKKYLEKLEKIGSFKIVDNYVNVYDDVIENILLRRSQHNLIQRQMRLNLNGSDSRSIAYIYSILMIQIICWGGKENMDKMMKQVNWAYEAGKDMRLRLTSKVSDEKDKDNSLRGVVYKLENQISVNDVTGFLDSIIRLYSSYGRPIPSIFKECRSSEELFKAIGQGFILGLKYQRWENDDSKKSSDSSDNNGGKE